MKPCRSLLLAVILLLPNNFNVAELMKIKFTNLQCEVYDTSFATFKKCFLKAISRDKVSLNIHVQLHQLPITNITVNAQMFLKGNGYRPYMYNDTIDYCKFYKNQNRYMFWKIIFAAVTPYSNFNHSCPIDSDGIIDKMILNADMFKLIPFPSNDYMFQMQFAAYNHYKAKVKTYFQIYD